MRVARNIAIILLLALGVAFVPGGGNAADAVFAALTLGFLAAIAWFVYVLSRQNQLTLATLGERRRAILYAAIGVIALLIAWADEMFDSGGGTLAWIVLIGAAAAAIWRVWMDAASLS